MDSGQYPIINNSAFLPFGSYMFVPGIFFSEMEQNDYLASLDSDTRDYVLKHTDEFRSRQDIEDCVNELHGRS